MIPLEFWNSRRRGAFVTVDCYVGGCWQLKHKIILYYFYFLHSGNVKMLCLQIDPMDVTDGYNPFVKQAVDMEPS